LLAAAATLAGTVVWMARQLVRGGGERPAFDIAFTVIGAVLAIASALAIWHPPAFTRPSFGPWVSLVAGMLVAGTGLVAVRRPRNAAAVRV
jgi:hypothetical protein